MLKICEKLKKEKIKNWLETELEKETGNISKVSYHGQDNSVIIFEIKRAGFSDYVVLNDFKLQADFLYDDEKINLNWLNNISKKCEELNVDYQKYYADEITKKHAKIVSENIKEFKDKLNQIKVINEEENTL